MTSSPNQQRSRRRAWRTRLAIHDLIVGTPRRTVMLSETCILNRCSTTSALESRTSRLQVPSTTQSWNRWVIFACSRIFVLASGIRQSDTGASSMKMSLRSRSDSHRSFTLALDFTWHSRHQAATRYLSGMSVEWQWAESTEVTRGNGSSSDPTTTRPTSPIETAGRLRLSTNRCKRRRLISAVASPRSKPTIARRA
jgi:hypothetical protein